MMMILMILIMLSIQNTTNDTTTSFAAVFRTKIPHVYGINSVRISFPRSDIPPNIGDSPDMFDPRILG